MRTGPLNNEQKLFLSLVCVMIGLGVVMVHSASITSWPSDFDRVYLSRHVIFLCLGAVAAAICANLPARVWYRYAPHLFVLTLLLLVVVLIPGVGTRVNGAQRWLRFGSISVQPSELAKLALPLLMARLLVRRRDRIRHWLWGTLPLVWPVLCVVPLVAEQPDLGTAVFLTCLGAITLFLGGWPLRNFVASGAAVVPAAVTLFALKPYQLERITGFVAAWRDFQKAPYQIKQSLLTLGAGGLTGVGLGRGWQKLSFLPEANTDFVFAVVGEELGLVGTLSLIGLWTVLYLTGLRLLRRLPRDSFAYIACAALLTQLVLQAALNVAVVTAVVPPKGIPHPLVSYGGSSLAVSLTAIGIMVSLTRARPGRDDVALR